MAADAARHTGAEDTIGLGSAGRVDELLFRIADKRFPSVNSRTSRGLSVGRWTG